MHKRSFGWITIKIHNKIKYLKVPTYVSGLGPEQAAKKVKEMLDKHWQEGSRNQKKLPEQRAAADS